jgi:hypothetical protein
MINKALLLISSYYYNDGIDLSENSLSEEVLHPLHLSSAPETSII